MKYHVMNSTQQFVFSPYPAVLKAILILHSSHSWQDQRITLGFGDGK